MKVGDRVATPDGEGTIVDIEHYSRIDGGINRYGVKHDEQQFSFPVAYYWLKEIKNKTSLKSAAKADNKY